MKYQQLWHHIETRACDTLPFPIPSKAMGRAGTVALKKVVEGKMPPPKKARTGDIKPHFVCASFRHAQWLRQVRRLQSYTRHVRVHGPQNAYALQVWGAIMRATGFTPSFGTWWTDCTTKVLGAPAVLPYVPPDLTEAQLVFDTLAISFRHLEQDLYKASRQYARQKREANPNAIFHDLQASRGHGVDLLLKPCHAVVESVRPDEGCLVLDKAMPFDVALPIFCHGAQIEVVHADTDALWVENVEHIPVGATVTQVTRRGTDQELFDLFLDAWKAMWERHSGVPQSRWAAILTFAHSKLKFRPLHWPPIDVHSLATSIAHKKSSTTGGLDGVSLLDLKSLPTNALKNFVSMFHTAEATGCWPPQVIAGRVTCLPKTEQPQEALDFRPITVFGLLYRCWGTYHARNAIRALDSDLPTGLYGSRPHRHAGQLWSHLLWAIELAYENQTQLCGIMADIQKAFNFLARPVVMECCALIGIPFPVLHAWAGALTGMQRRFQIRGSLSPPAASNCGLPEGCALSCLGMMVIDIVFHEYMLHFFPLCQPLSYVDDWQVLVADPSSLQPAFQCLESFTVQLDLLLDHRKTHSWSICPEGRTQLRSQGFGLVAFSKNLVAHVQYTRQHTNKVLMERVRSAQSLWHKLRISASPYAQKVRALKCAAWPRCLHAVAATTLSQATYVSLRAGAMRGLKADSAGANPMVHLGLTEQPCVDPQFWAWLQTVRLARECGSQDRVEGTLAALVEGHIVLPSNSITQTLLTRLQTLGWHVDVQGHIHDALGSFSLFHISAAELQYRAQLQWTQVVQSATAHRPCFQGLEFAHPGDTRKWVAQLTSSDQALFRKVLNGTHITQDGKHYCQECDSDICPFCECSDSRYHRFWICERFAFLRENVPEWILAIVPDLPEALTCAGWSLSPTTLHEWNRYLASLQHEPVQQFHIEGVINLFTDGSCFGQHCATTRFAGWAVIYAACEAVYDFQGSCIVDSGVLPGLLQSAVRAEIYAISRALQSVVDHPGKVMLWSDCDAVVKRVRKLLSGSEIKPNSSHSDLWTDIAQSLRDRQGITAITRVGAHQIEGHARDVFTEWCIKHNSLADRQAVRANCSRPPEFWQVFWMHSQAVENITLINRAIQELQLAVSREVVRHEEPQFVEVSPLEMELPTPVQPWITLPPLRIPAQAVGWYGDALVRIILSWFWQSVDGSSHALTWMSHYQLYIDFMCSTGQPGPVHLSRWVDGASISNISLRGFAFRQRARWFVKVWKESLKHLGIGLETAYGRPDSQVVLSHTGCVSLPWDRNRIFMVDQWMMSCAPTTYKRQSRAIDSLPYASLHPGFTPVYLTSTGL